MQVVVDSLLTHYEQEGSGNIVVLLHGWGDSSVGLRGLSRALSEKYQVITIDLPGFGKSQAPPADWGLSDYATFVNHFLTKVGINDVWAFVGHSNGGAIIIRGAAERTLTAHKVVLLASAGIRNVYKGRVKMLRIVAKIGKTFAQLLPAGMQERLRTGVYKTVGSDMLVAEHMQGTFKRIVTDDVRSDAPQLAMPVLLVYGENDDATPVWYGEHFRELMPDATLTVVPNSGHFVHIDNPEVVYSAVREFLQ